jgi:hypothetical protein
MSFDTICDMRYYDSERKDTEIIALQNLCRVIIKSDDHNECVVSNIFMLAFLFVAMWHVWPVWYHMSHTSATQGAVFLMQYRHMRKSGSRSGSDWCKNCIF